MRRSGPSLRIVQGGRWGGVLKQGQDALSTSGGTIPEAASKTICTRLAKKRSRLALYACLVTATVSTRASAAPDAL